MANPSRAQTFWVAVGALATAGLFAVALVNLQIAGAPTPSHSGDATAVTSLNPKSTLCPLMTLTAASGSNHVYYMYNVPGAATYYDDLPYGTTFVVNTTFVPSTKGDLVRITSGSVQGFSYAGKYVLVADIEYWAGQDWQSHCP